MKLVSLPAPLDIEHDSDTDFAKTIRFPFALTSAWGAEVVIQPSGDRPPLTLTIGSGLSVVQGKLVFALTREQLKTLARQKQPAGWYLVLIAAGNVRKKYLQGGLTIR